MEPEFEHVVSSMPHGDNPLANRFNREDPKPPDRFPRVAYVLQGGGSLGAYQFGVVKGLLEAGYEPDWIAATSIGAIQAAIIVGNPPDKRIEKLAQFWDKIAPEGPLDFLGEWRPTLDWYNVMAANIALLYGQPNFFYPRWWTELSYFSEDPTRLSVYNTEPLRDTLIELIDFDRLNSCHIRLSLGAVQVRTGHLIYFNNINYIIKPEHIMASAALPPGFPGQLIDGELYWDGGVHSNTPLEVILEAIPPENTLCFLIDCFGGHAFIPKNMSEVNERVKDITHSTHAQRTIFNYLLRQEMRNSMLELSRILTPEQRKQHANLLNIKTPNHCTLAHVLYSKRIVKAPSKDYNFGRVVINKRISIGYKDAQAMLAEEEQWGFLPKDGKSRLYESPHNRARLIRKRRG